MQKWYQNNKGQNTTTKQIALIFACFDLFDIPKRPSEAHLLKELPLAREARAELPLGRGAASPDRPGK